MSISARQAALFAGEVWTTLYNAYPQINFNATDPVSINQALQNYIKVNYPENFNDWIISSEFVALIDMLSWLAGSLAFKTDLAARENFIDTAEAKDSILRLARFLSYNPSRCQPATGIVKLISVATDDDVFDSFGTDLANTTINWNDPNNANWQEQFTDVLNAAFVTTNPFGIPLTSGRVSNVATQLYQVNGLFANSSFSFSSTVSGIGMDFEVCNANFTDGGTLYEQTPNPTNGFNLYYLNDGNGSSSIRTGFFLLFKQGTTQTQLFNITVPIENQLLDIGSTNVNQNDVWVQTVNDSGAVTTTWVMVPSVVNSNITYNNVPATERNIFAVLTRDNDQITIRFADGLFGNAPAGNIQITYRVSNGLSYQIQPLEISNVTLPISYLNPLGVSHTLTLTFSLYETVANAAPSETIEQIRQRAPQVYATQNRMVSGGDYNAFPLSTNLAAKIKAVNRVYSGQSRYIDLADPTGTYQDLSLFADDGIIFADPRNTYIEIPTSLGQTTAQIVTNYLLPALNQYTTVNLISDVLMQNVLQGSIVSAANTWTTASASLFQTTGWFSAIDYLIQPGAIIQFAIAGTPTWVAVIGVDSTMTAAAAPNTAGPVTLAQEVPTGSTVMAVLPAANVQPGSSVMATVGSNISLKLSFSLWYDYFNSNSPSGPVWTIQTTQNDFGTPPAALVGTQLLLMTVNYISGMWQINARGLAWVFESINDIEWFDNGVRGLAQLTGEATADTIRVMRVNRDLNNPAGYALPMDYTLAIDRLWLYPDGTPEPRRTMVTFYDSNQDGYPDQPDTFYKLIAAGMPYSTTASNQSGDSVLTVATTSGISVGQSVAGIGVAVGTTVTALSSTTLSLSMPLTQARPSGSVITISDPRLDYLFWSNATNPPYDQPLYTVQGYDTDALLQAATPPVGTVGFQVSATLYLNDATFWVYLGNHVWQQDVIGTYRYELGRGPNVAAGWTSASRSVTPSGDALAFHWKHLAPSDHRIDPACTNVHDIFVLTFAYDTAVRQWITAGAAPTATPVPPTELDLSLAFAAMEEFKMFSDQLVWRPVTYKFLFGRSADPELQAQFKVVRVANAAVSDGQIQTQIITAINNYFSVSNWDFGETFYFTELAAYIHQQLVGLIGSVVLVPLAADSAFGEGFEVACQPNEIFLSTAQVSDIVLIQSNTAANLRIRIPN